MIKIVFKDYKIIEIENSDNLSSAAIFCQIRNSKLVKIYDYIFNLNDVLYIKIVKQKYCKVFYITKLPNVFKKQNKSIRKTHIQKLFGFMCYDKFI